MNKIISLIIIVIFNQSLIAQDKLDSLSFNNLVLIGELYYNNGKLMTPNGESKDFYELLNSYKTPALENVVELLNASRKADNSVIAEKFLKRPSNNDLQYWYVIREIHYNLSDSLPIENSKVARTILDSIIDTRALLDNYYYRLTRGINFNNADLSSVDFNIEKYGLKDETEKVIFFFNITGQLIQRFLVLQMMKNSKKTLEFAKKLPTFNGDKYYYYNDFDFPDFEWIGYEKVEMYKERHLNSYYNSLLAHFGAIAELKGKKNAAEIYLNSILSKQEYFKYSQFEDLLNKLYEQ